MSKLQEQLPDMTASDLLESPVSGAGPMVSSAPSYFWAPIEKFVKRPIYRKLPTSGIIGRTHIPCTGPFSSSLLSGDAGGRGGELP